MGRTRVIKLSDEEYQDLLEAKKTVKQQGNAKLSKKAKATLTDDALGSYVHLGSQLIKEFYEGGE